MCIKKPDQAVNLIQDYILIVRFAVFIFDANMPICRPKNRLLLLFGGANNDILIFGGIRAPQSEKSGFIVDGIRAFIAEIVGLGAYSIILSGAKGGEYKRINIVFSDGSYFAEKLTEKQAFHERFSAADAPERIFELFSGFSQINAWGLDTEYTARITKKGKLLAGKHAASSAPKMAGGERKKNYLLPDGTVVAPLVDMGVMAEDGRVNHRGYDKFRQINRFLEFIDEFIDEEDMASGRPLNIVDFGCGKSYLTFVVYYYFTVIRKKRVNMTGIDLKRDVIDFCGALAEKYGYDGLKFYCGDIADFERATSERIDLVISLHACDTATDLVLYSAARFGAKYILSSPCCQHELNKSADLSAFPLFDDDGILRERACALMTDSIRQKLLTALGYTARVMEFVELSHTPKNLMIRAKKAAIPHKKRLDALKEVEASLAVIRTEQKLHSLLSEAGMLSGLCDECADKDKKEDAQ